MADILFVFSAFLTVTLCILNVMDALLTDSVIEAGGHESAPVMKYIFESPFLYPYRWGIKFLVLGAFLMVAWTFASDWALVLLLGVLNAVFVWVIVHNSEALDRQIKKNRGD
jgi:hypothetical protein